MTEYLYHSSRAMDDETFAKFFEAGPNVNLAGWYEREIQPHVREERFLKKYKPVDMQHNALTELGHPNIGSRRPAQAVSIPLVKPEPVVDQLRPAWYVLIAVALSIIGIIIANYIPIWTARDTRPPDPVSTIEVVPVASVVDEQILPLTNESELLEQAGPEITPGNSGLPSPAPVPPEVHPLKLTLRVTCYGLPTFTENNNCANLSTIRENYDRAVNEMGLDGIVAVGEYLLSDGSDNPWYHEIYRDIPPIIFIDGHGSIPRGAYLAVDRIGSGSDIDVWVPYTPGSGGPQWAGNAEVWEITGAEE